MKNKRIIKKNHEFQKIISSKRSIVNSNFILYVAKNENPVGLKYGVSVGKKIGNAVVRNHIKREVRMIVNGFLNKYEGLNYDVIIVVRKRFVYKTYEINQKALDSLFNDLSKNKNIVKS